MTEPCQPETALLEASSRVTCVKCAYSLAGLPKIGVCPECGWSVNSSVLAYERQRIRTLPLDRFRRLVVIAFWSMWGVLVAGRWLLPTIARAIGMHVEPRKSSEFYEVYVPLVAVACVVGGIMIVLLFDRRPWWALATLLAIVALIAVCLPELGVA